MTGSRAGPVEQRRRGSRTTSTRRPPALRLGPSEEQRSPSHGRGDLGRAGPRQGTGSTRAADKKTQDQPGLQEDALTSLCSCHELRTEHRTGLCKRGLSSLTAEEVTNSTSQPVSSLPSTRVLRKAMEADQAHTSSPAPAATGGISAQDVWMSLDMRMLHDELDSILRASRDVGGTEDVCPSGESGEVSGGRSGPLSSCSRQEDQWGPPDTPAEIPTPNTDASSADELDSAGWSSQEFGWMENPLSPDSPSDQQPCLDPAGQGRDLGAVCPRRSPELDLGTTQSQEHDLPGSNEERIGTQILGGSGQTWEPKWHTDTERHLSYSQNPTEADRLEIRTEHSPDAAGSTMMSTATVTMGMQLSRQLHTEDMSDGSVSSHCLCQTPEGRQSPASRDSVVPPSGSEVETKMGSYMTGIMEGGEWETRPSLNVLTEGCAQPEYSTQTQQGAEYRGVSCLELEEKEDTSTNPCPEGTIAQKDQTGTQLVSEGDMRDLKRLLEELDMFSHISSPFEHPPSLIPLQQPELLEKHEQLEQPELLETHEQLEQPELSEKHEELEQPELLEKHEQLEQPELLETHEQLEQPELLETHEQLEQPELLETHEELEQPELLEKHEQLEQPELLETHEQLEQPELLEKHEQLEQPELLEKHEQLVQPELLETHEQLEQPELLEKHEQLEQPELLETHEQLEQPELLEKHEQLEQPELLEKHEELEQPELLEKHEQLEQPELLETHGQLEQPELFVNHEELEQPGLSEKHEELEQPELLEKHEQLEQPELLEKHEQLEQPELLETHEQLEQPELLEKHEQLEQPELLETHEQLEQPELLETHEQLEHPELLETHEQLEQPELLETLEELEQPELSETHEQSEQPELLEKHEPFEKHELLEQPELLETHEQLEHPELLETHEQLEQPELLETLEELEQPELSETHEQSEQPELLEKHEPFEKHELLEQPGQVGKLVQLEQPLLLEKCAQLEQPELLEKPVMFEEPVLFEQSVPLEPPVKLEQPMQSEKPVQSEEPVLCEQFVLLEPPLTLRQPVLLGQPVWLEPAVHLEPRARIEQPVQQVQPVLLDRPVQLKQPVRVEQPMRFEYPMRSERPIRFKQHVRLKHPVWLEPSVQFVPHAQLQRKNEQEPCSEQLSNNRINSEQRILTQQPLQPEQTPTADPEQTCVPQVNENGVGVKRETARQLAERLYKLQDIQRTEVVGHMDKDNEFSRAVGQEYLKFFDFTGQTLDQALRSFLKVVVLIGESQERERVLQHFSERFQDCNPGSFSSSGSVLTLTCALMLLNTDLHGQNVGKPMSSSSFVSNLDGMNDGKSFHKDMLKDLYTSIKSEPLQWAIAEEELKLSLLSSGDKKADLPAGRSFNPFQDVPHDEAATKFKEGFLARKAHADIDRKRTPWGKRGWKTFYAVLKGMVLYLMKAWDCVLFKKPLHPLKQFSAGGARDQNSEDLQSAEEVISVHHSLCEPELGYSKRPHVFRLQTADWRVYLLQADSAAQVSSWISRMNLASALYSSPPFAAAVGSQRRFSRPTLPAAPSKLPLDKTVQSHSSMLQSFREDLQLLQLDLANSRPVRSRELGEQRQREEYLQHETTRYEVYLQMLEVWQGLGGEVGGDELELFDSEVRIDTVEEPQEAGLKKAYSSPSLSEEVAVPKKPKIKRNISERRTQRRLIIPRRNKDLGASLQDLQDTSP